MTQILFLRAVNLGNTNKVPMKRLMQVMSAAALGEPSFLLQSGNVIVSDPQLALGELKRATEELIRSEFGVSTVVIARTPARLAQVVAANPFSAPAGGSVQVAFWDAAPETDYLAALAAERFEDAELSLTDGAAYMRYEGSSHTSKLSNSLLERRLKVPSTARNVNTLHRLLALEAVASQLD